MTKLIYTKFIMLIKFIDLALFFAKLSAGHLRPTKKPEEPLLIP